MRTPSQDFIVWMNAEFYSLYRVDQNQAISAAKNKVNQVRPEDQAQLRSTLEAMARKNEGFANIFNRREAYFVIGLVLAAIGTYVAGGWAACCAVVVATVTPVAMSCIHSSRKATATIQVIAALKQ